MVVLFLKVSIVIPIVSIGPAGVDPLEKHRQDGQNHVRS